MGELYTPERRAEILENLLTFFEADDQVLGVVLVGSSAAGFRDAYSDINLLAAVSNDISLYPLYQKWKTRLTTLYPPLAAFENIPNPDDYGYSCLLENYLPLELHWTKLRRIQARQKPWRIVFDRSQQLEQLLEQAYQTEQTTAPVREYTRIMETVWLPIFKCVAALRRNEIWRALYLLEDLRRQTVELAGMNHGIDTQGFSAVDDLPEMFLVHLRHTIPTSTSIPAIRRALRTAVVLLFAEISTIEQRLELPRKTSLRQKILTYIEAYS